jgi:hypothetical protein
MEKLLDKLRAAKNSTRVILILMTIVGVVHELSEVGRSMAVSGR